MYASHPSDDSENHGRVAAPWTVCVRARTVVSRLRRCVSSGPAAANRFRRKSDLQRASRSIRLTRQDRAEWRRNTETRLSDNGNATSDVGTTAFVRPAALSLTPRGHANGRCTLGWQLNPTTFLKAQLFLLMSVLIAFRRPGGLLKRASAPR